MGSPNTSADFFANSSAETVTQNEYPPAPVIDDIMRDSFLKGSESSPVTGFMTEVTLPSRICCPFCIMDFGFEPLLKDHIKESHSREVKHILRTKPSHLKFYECPFCLAKFYSKDLLPKHIIRKHELCVVNMFSGFSPEKYVYCRFCPHKIMRKHYKLLMIHIEKKHFDLFERYVIEKYSNISNSIENLVEECEVAKEKKEKPIYDTPGLSHIMTALSTNEPVPTDSPSFKKSILKPQTAYPLDKSEENLELTGTDYENTNIIKQATKRKLRFDLPDSPGKENQNSVKRSKWKNPLKAKKAKPSPPEQSNEADSELAQHLSQFRCGLCKECFDLNAKLVCHLRKKHKGITLKPQYRCGLCSAKFYRNSYLVQHCWHHHAPLCLKTPVSKQNSSKF